MKTNEQIYLKLMVAFTLPNATSLPWLTDQGVVAIFMALHCVISNYKNFGNNVAITGGTYITESCRNVPVLYMHGVW
jgi:hypothetical protein